MNAKFDDIDYLKSGTKCQKQAYALLKKHHILYQLRDFFPIVTGTIPINIDIEGSDLDIICYYTHKNHFIKTLRDSFQDHQNFILNENASLHAVTTNFYIDNFEIEIFRQNIPTKKQFAYRHMIVENNLLKTKRNEFRNRIIQLKKQGYKTEPAFAIALGLTGDPYLELLKFEQDPD